MIGALSGLNLALAFFLELCALGALAYWGFNASEITLLRLILGLGAPLAMIIFWGIYLAPKSSRRLKEPTMSVAKLVIFGLTAAALASTGQATTAAIFMAAVILNLALALFWRQH
jgi:hypothetical protein